MATKQDVIAGVEALIEHIKADYSGWQTRAKSDIKQKMIAEFNNGLSFKVSRKFVKIITGGSVHSFVVIAEGEKFPVGTILKAASWSAPAKNFGRGNVLDRSFGRIQWTGAI